MKFLVLGNETVAVAEKAVDESVFDTRKPVLEMYKASIKEYEARIRFAKSDEEKLAFLRLLDILKQDVKKFSVTEAEEQYAPSDAGSTICRSCSTTCTECLSSTATTTR